MIVAEEEGVQGCTTSNRDAMEFEEIRKTDKMRTQSVAVHHTTKAIDHIHSFTCFFLLYL